MYFLGSGEFEISDDDVVEFVDVGVFFLNKLCFWFGGWGLNLIRFCELELVGRFMFEFVFEFFLELLSLCRVIKDNIIMIYI